MVAGKEKITKTWAHKRCRWHKSSWAVSSWAQRQSWRFKPSASGAIAAACTPASCAFESLRIHQAVPWKTGTRKLSSIHLESISHSLVRAKLLLILAMCACIFIKRWLDPPGPADAGVIGPWAAAETPGRVSWMWLAQVAHCKQGLVVVHWKVWFVCSSQLLWWMKT